MWKFTFVFFGCPTILGSSSVWVFGSPVPRRSIPPEYILPCSSRISWGLKAPKEFPEWILGILAVGSSAAFGNDLKAHDSKIRPAPKWEHWMPQWTISGAGQSGAPRCCGEECCFLVFSDVFWRKMQLPRIKTARKVSQTLSESLAETTFWASRVCVILIPNERWSCCASAFVNDEAVFGGKEGWKAATCWIAPFLSWVKVLNLVASSYQVHDPQAWAYRGLSRIFWVIPGLVQISGVPMNARSRSARLCQERSPEETSEQAR